MSNDLSSTLEKRIQPDKTVEYATSMDMKTFFAAQIPSIIRSEIAGVIIAVTSFIFVVGVIGPLMGVISLLLLIGIAAAPLIYAFVVIKYGAIDYAITDNRFIKVKDTVFESDEESVPIERVRDAELDEDFFDKMLGNGDIYIEGARGDSLLLENVPDADEFYKKAQKKIQDTKQVDDFNA